MAEESEQESQEILMQYRKRENQFNVIKHRTDTEKFQDDFKTYLTGSKTITYQDEKGNIKTKKIVYGVAKANEAGIQGIMNFVSSAINPHTLQGNFPLDSKAFSVAYENHCYNLELDFIDMLMKNFNDWEINEYEYQSIIDTFMAAVKPIMSRCIGNEERNSYGETSTSVEHHGEVKKGGGILSQI